MLELNFNPFPVIETERLRMRQTMPEDLDFLFFLRSHNDVMKYIDRPFAKSKQDIIEMYEKMCAGVKDNTAIPWHIEEKESGKPAGQIGFYRNDPGNHRGEVGYMLSPEQQGKGFAGEALKAVLNYGFNDVKFHSIEANVNPLNDSSVKLLEKHGFVKEAHFKENYYFDGKFLDSVIYSLLGSAWKNRS
jgi:ribosomal-protein-alanine N-acetyltransferase